MRRAEVIKHDPNLHCDNDDRMWGCGGALISPEQERKIGVDVHNEIKKEYKLVKPSSTLGEMGKELHTTTSPSLRPVSFT